MQNQKALEILKEAILLERRGKAFYLQAADNTKSEAAEEIFRMMAEEEDEHIKYLSVQFANYAKKGEFIKPDTNINDEHDAVAMKVLSEKFKNQVDAASYEAAAIAAALDFEMRAVKVYSDRAKESDDIHEKELYQILADWEKGHHEMLKNLNDEIKESIWNDNQFWPY
ncbi:MAG: ferritin family protein [Bacteroidales bacterium]|jgi:rubrerythrin|nr:ferritin family protein [Bacteroidales bacterium]